jgi:PleD family two-component response regulator
MKGEISSYTIEKRYIRKDGTILWAELTINLVSDPRGNPEYTMAFVADISARHSAEEALKHLALHDALTGLPNRTLLENMPERTLERAEAEHLPADEATAWLHGQVTRSRTEESRRHSLLVVDDDLTYLKLLRIVLSAEGYEVLTVASGEDVEAALRDTSPDMILLDRHLGSADGLELADQLRSDGRLQETVIVCWSASASPEDVARARSSGCDAFVSKPTSTVEITRLVSRHLAA